MIKVSQCKVGDVITIDGHKALIKRVIPSGNNNYYQFDYLSPIEVQENHFSTGGTWSASVFDMHIIELIEHKEIQEQMSLFDNNEEDSGLYE